MIGEKSTQALLQIGELPMARYEVRRGLKSHCCTRKIDCRRNYMPPLRSAGANEENSPRRYVACARPFRAES